MSKKKTVQKHYEHWSVQEIRRQIEKEYRFRDMFETRYVVIDDETGEIIDDAQGYGYKSKQSAIKAFSYKNNPEKRKESESFKKVIKDWWNEHKDVMDFVADMEFYAWKDREPLSERDICDLVRKYIDEHDIKRPDGYHVWQLVKYMN